MAAYRRGYHRCKRANCRSYRWRAAGAWTISPDLRHRSVLFFAGNRCLLPKNHGRIRDHGSRRALSRSAAAESVRVFDLPRELRRTSANVPHQNAGRDRGRMLLVSRTDAAEPMADSPRQPRRRERLHQLLTSRGKGCPSPAIRTEVARRALWT